jgi:transposase
MKNREGGIVGYNLLAAVDSGHRLIVAHEVINEGVDRDQLVTMAQKAKGACEKS